MPPPDDPTARELGDQYERTDEERRHSAALKIQRYYKIRKRAKFLSTYRDMLHSEDWNNYELTSVFLKKFIFSFDANQEGDIDVLCKICDKLLQYAGDSSKPNEILGVFTDRSENSMESLVLSRVFFFALICMHSTHHKRYEWVTDLASVNVLRILACLIDPKFVWSCQLVGYLQENKTNFLFREIITAFPKKHHGVTSPLEHLLLVLASHGGSNLCNCQTMDPRWSFSSQVLSVPFIWDRFPHFKAFYATRLRTDYVNQINSLGSICVDILPKDISSNYPGYVCLLANVLEIEASDKDADIVAMAVSLMDAIRSSFESAVGDNTLLLEVNNELHVDLQIQIIGIIKHMVNVVFAPEPSNIDMQAVASVCYFLHSITNTFQLDGLRTVLAHHTHIVYSLWTSLKLCYECGSWDSFSNYILWGPSDALGWLLPLNIFCPLFKCTLEVIIDDYAPIENFTCEDLKLLVLILKEALWELLSTIPQEAKTSPNYFGLKKIEAEIIKANTCSELCDLLTELQYFSNRHQHLVDNDESQLLMDDDFCTEQEISPDFVNQAIIPDTREAKIIKLAPFLVPYAIRVQIFDLFLATSKQTASASHTMLRIKIRELFLNALAQLKFLSEEDLKGTMTVQFIDKNGLPEEGVDGGGLIREFVTNFVEIAFGPKLNFFKGTPDNLMYPNPHANVEFLERFHFIGVLLGKALYEKIPVGVRFAKFFLRRLKHKSTTFNDIASLDKITYKGLLMSKTNLHDMPMSFEIQYGDIVKELIAGGDELDVTNDNIILYLNLYANHRLDQEVHNHTLRFLKGFQKVVPKEWISMFTESELQMLMSGPEKWDIDDLRNNTHYGGEYNDDHDVIKMFWEILEEFKGHHQKKFLKFVTGCSHISIRGFQALDPKFGIVRLGEHTNGYPESSTCANLLKLPAYETKEEMKGKLIAAIKAEVGFHNE